MSNYLGIDIGSVSTNVVLINEEENIIKSVYTQTCGKPIKALCKAISDLKESDDKIIGGVGATGSGRWLAGIIAGADIIKNEITTHATASIRLMPEVRTILEIGGQDSKIIYIEKGRIIDFAMNTVCAAGTGSFLDRQAERLGVPLSEFGRYARSSVTPARIAGRCAVFAESDMIHKQQAGSRMEDIIRGLCEALVRNYLNNLARGKEIKGPVVFQGGVAANEGIVDAFRLATGKDIIIPEHYDVMGAYGAALLALRNRSETVKFRGFKILSADYETRTRECDGCINSCEIADIIENGEKIASWGSRCGKK